jgi:O-antigen ligase
MKELFFIEDSLTNKISYWLLAAFLITLPFDLFYSEIILFCFTLHTFLHCRKSYFTALLYKEVWLLAAMYLLSIVTILYSVNKAAGVDIATRQLAIILFPVLFALSSFPLYKYYLALFKFFVASIAFTCMYLYFDAFHTIAYFHLPVSSLFTLAFMNHNFAMAVEMHATYLSLYVAFSIVILLYLVCKKNNTTNRVLYIAAIILLSASLLQLASRAVIIAILIIVNVALPLFILRAKRRIVFFILSFTFSAVLLLGITQIASFKTRYISELKKDLSDKLSLIEVDESRAIRWEAISELIKKSPVIGYGSGSEQHLLEEKYFEKKLYVSYLNHLDTHNEYLNVLLKAGVLGLTVFVYVLFAGFSRVWQKKDFLFAAFLILIGVVFISENILDSNKGIFFYSFFFSVFLLKDVIKHRSV